MGCCWSVRLLRQAHPPVASCIDCLAPLTHDDDLDLPLPHCSILKTTGSFISCDRFENFRAVDTNMRTYNGRNSCSMLRITRRVPRGTDFVRSLCTSSGTVTQDLAEFGELVKLETAHPLRFETGVQRQTGVRTPAHVNRPLNYDRDGSIFRNARERGGDIRWSLLPNLGFVPETQ